MSPHSACLLACLASFITLGTLGAAEPGNDSGKTNPDKPTIKPPRLLVEDWTIELIASEPRLVTPTASCLDDDGHLLVVECHTHFPSPDYQGPKTDRVYRFAADADADADADENLLRRQRLFFEGGHATMAIANLGDGWIGLLTRDALKRVRDSNADGVADETETLLRLVTEAAYPHNGLSSLAVGPDGWLYVGQGENFGESYELVGSDDSRQIGSAEGGNIFRCRPDGSQVQRVATGFWNPFGMCFDPQQRLWAVGNDPDAMPPNRLLHVVPTADFGFQFRFGRAGTHPLQAWNGELPGTLPMAASVGEAVCDVAVHDGHLWVTSWGDNRIERYALQSQGASLSSRTEVVVQGDALFRPVSITVARDGSIYVTDWVDRSYPVHGKGRIWRLSRVATAAPVEPHATRLPELSAAERVAKALREDEDLAIQERVAALDEDDPFLRQAAIAGLIQTAQLAKIDRDAELSPQQRGGLMTAWRWIDLTQPDDAATSARRDDWIRWGLAQTSEQVVLPAIRWAAESDAREHLPAIEQLLSRRELSPRLFEATVAAIAYLETGSASSSMRDPATEQRLLEIASDADRAATIRALAVRSLSEQATAPTSEQLAAWAIETNLREFSLEVVRLLAARQSEPAGDALAGLAANETLDLQTRADALAGLARTAGRHSGIINRMSLPRQAEVLRSEARRILNRRSYDGNGSIPGKEELEKWDALVGSGGDIDAGRRVFVRKTCVNCHAHTGRGARTGPDLTSLAGQMTSQRVLESILSPSKEMSPMYVPWRILTVDGKVLTGLKLQAPGVGQALRFQGADGNLFDVPLSDIEQQEPISQSIMPAGLEQSMSRDELRDLVAFLTGETLSE